MFLGVVWGLFERCFWGWFGVYLQGVFGGGLGFTWKVFLGVVWGLLEGCFWGWFGVYLKGVFGGGLGFT